MPREVTGLPGQPVDGTQITAQSFDMLHRGRSLIPLDVADQELADGVFDLSSVFPASLKSLVGDMRTPCHRQVATRGDTMLRPRLPGGTELNL